MSTKELGYNYGGQFSLVPDNRADLPQDAYSTSGARGQFCVIVPSYDLDHSTPRSGLAGEAWPEPVEYARRGAEGLFTSGVAPQKAGPGALRR
jgi:hypothetical protein